MAREPCHESSSTSHYSKHSETLGLHNIFSYRVKFARRNTERSLVRGRELHDQISSALYRRRDDRNRHTLLALDSNHRTLLALYCHVFFQQPHAGIVKTTPASSPVWVFVYIPQIANTCLRPILVSPAHSFFGTSMALHGSSA